MQDSFIGKGRLEAFSDGVIAIILTIMVLELKVPNESTWEAFGQLAPILLSYALSFLVVAIMWINHHHMMHLALRVSAKLLWLNMTLLFWMSLIPFVTTWMGEHHRQALPVSAYGLVLTFCTAAFSLLRAEIGKQAGENRKLSAHHSTQQRKVLAVLVLYMFSVGAAFLSVYISEFVFALVAGLYFVPERHPITNRD